MNSHGGNDRAILRRCMRKRRCSLSPGERARGAAQIAGHLSRPPLPPPLSVAAYVADEGEPELTAFFEAADAQGITLALPAVTDCGLRFLRWKPGDPLKPGRFGIPIPSHEVPLPLTDLDWVLVPLVAFDERGARLGRGGGMYDRTFEGHHPGDRPLLIGIGYDWQEVARIPKHPWDVDVDFVVTPSGWHGPWREA